MKRPLAYITAACARNRRRGHAATNLGKYNEGALVGEYLKLSDPPGMYRRF